MDALHTASSGLFALKSCVRRKQICVFVFIVKHRTKIARLEFWGTEASILHNSNVFLQAMFFYMPTVVWHGMNQKAGVDCDSILACANTMQTLDKVSIGTSFGGKFVYLECSFCVEVFECFCWMWSGSEGWPCQQCMVNLLS